MGLEMRKMRQSTANELKAYEGWPREWRLASDPTVGHSAGWVERFLCLRPTWPAEDLADWVFPNSLCAGRIGKGLPKGQDWSLW